MNQIKTPYQPTTKYNPNTFSALIPQLYYDLIARVIPGLVILVSFYIIFNLSDLRNTATMKLTLHWYSLCSDNIFIATVNIIISSYVVAFVFNGFVSLIYDHFDLFTNFFLRQYINVKTEVEKLFKETFKKIPVTKIRTDNYAILYDLIRIEEPGAGARIVKIRAEYHMSRVLVLGFLVLSIVNPIVNKASSTLLELFFILSLISFLFTFLTRRKRFLWGLCNHWLYILNRGKLY